MKDPLRALNKRINKSSFPKIDGYTIQKKLGQQGTMGVVYQAIQNSLDRKVVLKLISTNILDETHIKRFITEAKTTAKIKHSNIVKIIDFGEIQDNLFYSMEYVDGTPLNKFMGQQKISLKKILNLIVSLLDALTVIHKEDIIHRDIKSSNIMITPNEQPILLDFGLAKKIAGERMTATNAQIGTIEYMSPEQLEGEKDIDSRADIYSLGTVFYEMLKGDLPFPNDRYGHKKMAREAEVPTDNEKLNKICLKAIAKEKGNRYQSAFEFHKELLQFTQRMDKESSEAEKESDDVIPEEIKDSNGSHINDSHISELIKKMGRRSEWINKLHPIRDEYEIDQMRMEIEALKKLIKDLATKRIKNLSEYITELDSVRDGHEIDQMRMEIKALKKLIKDLDKK